MSIQLQNQKCLPLYAGCFVAKLANNFTENNRNLDVCFLFLWYLVTNAFL